METGWLIESENGMYIGISHCYQVTRDRASLGWISDHNTAMRFARKQDAEDMIKVCRGIGIGFHEDAKGATEHAWYLL